MVKTKTARKQVTSQATAAPLDKNDPRVRAAAAELIAEIVAKQKAERATQVEKEAKDRAALEQAEKTKPTKRVSMKEIVRRLHKITEPLRALHDTAEQAFNGSDHEAALIVASNLSMVCLKRLEDCLVDLGDTWAGGSTDAWLAGTAP
jgi:DNA-binding PucR family transcriptional regulator